MCGICGKFYFRPDKIVDARVLTRMTKSLQRRGPDDEGYFVHGNVGFGVRRLSILDKGRGRQPFCNEDKTVWLVFNGEIYNYPDLKKFLSEKGHVFYTGCDGEVLPHLYEELGVSFLRELDGMFSLALMDLKERRFLLARDRMGMKPLYFSRRDDSITFASQVDTLLQGDDVKWDFDPRGIDCYFSYNYFPSETTPFKDIKKLQTGTYLVCDADKIEIAPYASWAYKHSSARSGAGSSYQDEFRLLFERSVKRHLAADVPVGIFLSGGLDSSGMASYARKFSEDLQTFSIGFKEASYDERRYAAAVARHLKTRHHDIVIESDIPTLLDKAVACLDIPMGEPSFLPTLELSEYAKNYAGVVLSGEGADELFGGYQTYQADMLAMYLKKIPPLLRNKILPFAIKIFPSSELYLNRRMKAELFLAGLNEKAHTFHYSWRMVFSEEEKRLFYSRDFLNSIAVDGDRSKRPYHIFEQVFYGINSQDYLERAMHFDARVWLPESVLHRVDAASMYNGLEVRMPFLDNEILDFAYRLPLNEKIRLGGGKCLLKKVFKEELPGSILRRPKHGFSVPVGGWLRHELKERFSQTVFHAPGEIDGMLNRQQISLIWQEHLAGVRDHGRKLWNLMIFIRWFTNLLQKRSCGGGREF